MKALADSVRCDELGVHDGVSGRFPKVAHPELAASKSGELITNSCKEDSLCFSKVCDFAADYTFHTHSTFFQIFFGLGP